MKLTIAFIFEFCRLWQDFSDRINKIFFCFYPEHPVYPACPVQFFVEDERSGFIRGLKIRYIFSIYTTKFPNTHVPPSPSNKDAKVKADS